MSSPYATNSVILVVLGVVRKSTLERMKWCEFVVVWTLFFYLFWSVKFPHSPILHYAFSSWIEKLMTKTVDCHWENRFVLQYYGAVRKFYLLILWCSALRFKNYLLRSLHKVPVRYVATITSSKIRLHNITYTSSASNYTPSNWYGMLCLFMVVSFILEGHFFSFPKFTCTF